MNMNSWRYPFLAIIICITTVRLYAQEKTVIDCLFEQGEWQTKMNKFDDAYTTYLELEEIVTDTTNYELMLHFHQKMGLASGNIGNVIAFKSNYEKAISIIDNKLDSIHPLKHKVYSDLIMKMIFVDFDYSEKYRLQYRRHLDTHYNESGETNYLKMLGVKKAIKGEFYAAIKYFEELLKRNNSEYVEYVQTYINLSFFYDRVGQVDKSFSYNVKALNTLKQEEFIDHHLMSQILNTLSGNKTQKNVLTKFKGLHYANKAIEHAYKCNNTEKGLMAYMSKLRHLLNLALLVPTDSSYYKSSMSTYDTICLYHRLFEEEFNKTSIRFTKIANEYLTDYFIFSERPIKANYYLGRSFDLEGKEQFNKVEWMKYYTRQAGILSLQQNHLIALITAQKALNIFFEKELKDSISYEFNPLSKDGLKHQYHYLSALEVKIMGLNQLFLETNDSLNLVMAEKSFLLFDSIFNPTININYLKKYAGLEIYKNKLINHYNLDDFYKAIFHVENVKTYALLDKLTQTSEINNSNMPDTVKLKIGLLKEQYDILKNMSDNNTVGEVDNSVDFNIKQDQKLKEYLDYKKESELKYSNHNGFSEQLNRSNVDSLKKYLATIEHQTILEYAISKNQINVLIHDPYHKKIITLGTNSVRLEEIINQLRTKLSNNEPFNDLAQELYRLLFEPIKKYCTTNNLLIIPDKEMYYLPFDILMNENNRYLIEDYSIRNTHSLLWELFEIKRPKKRNRNEVMAIAASPEMTAYASVYRDTTREGLGYLPGVKSELKELKKLVRGIFIANDEATETFFKQNVSNYGTIHLAMHAIIDDIIPENSRLVFNQEESQENDSYLNCHEIINLKMNANLITLSACNSGFGELKEGSGIQSLSTAFALAGCPNSVSSLWTVHDKSSTSIMSSFYELLEQGVPTYEAIRQSKLNFLHSQPNEKKHPYYWGGYVYFGNNASIEISSPTYLYQDLLLGVFGLILIFFTAKKYFFTKDSLL